jgi:hypothetical protein
MKILIWPKSPEPGLQIKGFALLHCMAAFGIGLPGGALASRQFSVMRV